MQIAYDKDQYNYMYRICKFFMEECKEIPIQNMINDFLTRIEDSIGWYTHEGKIKAVLTLTDADIEVLLYVYENIIFFTAEGQRIMRVCEDRYTYIKNKSFEGEKK